MSWQMLCCFFWWLSTWQDISFNVFFFSWWLGSWELHPDIQVEPYDWSVWADRPFAVAYPRNENRHGTPESRGPMVLLGIENSYNNNSNNNNNRYIQYDLWYIYIYIYTYIYIYKITNIYIHLLQHMCSPFSIQYIYTYIYTTYLYCINIKCI